MKNAAATLAGSRFIACLASILLFCIAAPASAQFAQAAQFALSALFAQSAQAASWRAKESERERAIKRCKENRGADCESWEGLREWREQERPLTAEEQAAAAGARRHRDACAKNKKALNC